MSAPTSLGAQRLYVVTPLGHAAALAEPSCRCLWILEPPLFVCRNCGQAVPAKRSTAHDYNRKHV